MLSAAFFENQLHRSCIPTELKEVDARPCRSKSARAWHSPVRRRSSRVSTATNGARCLNGIECCVTCERHKRRKPTEVVAPSRPGEHLRANSFMHGALQLASMKQASAEESKVPIQ